ncbi:hypothetical protein PIB30_016764 [Stylosanthes scabra]|uniref:Uncharacterized protein n=1 Tax=Stylosanthes scabra TaxID=79078 RepID=A0ABU6Q849_9FABA|nr:hypothetical protein [Stylosanthes scabra]
MFLHLGHTPTLVVSSAKMLKEIMKNHELAFLDRFKTTAVRILMYGCNDIAFANYGQNYTQMKRIFVLELFGPKLMQSLRLIREEEVTKLVKNLRELAARNTSDVNLSEMILDTLNSIICKSSLGCNTQDYDYESAKGIARKVTTQLEGWQKSPYLRALALISREIPTGTVTLPPRINGDEDEHRSTRSI